MSDRKEINEEQIERLAEEISGLPISALIQLRFKICEKSGINPELSFSLGGGSNESSKEEAPSAPKEYKIILKGVGADLPSQMPVIKALKEKMKLQVMEAKDMASKASSGEVIIKSGLKNTPEDEAFFKDLKSAIEGSGTLEFIPV